MERRSAMGEYSVGIATKRRIYEESKRLFYAKGIKGTSYTDICNAAEVNRGLIPYHFKSKSGIAVEVLAEFIQNMEIAVNEWLEPLSAVQLEHNIMIELLMFRMLSEDRNACRFYSEIHTDDTYREKSLDIQSGVMREFAEGGGVEVSPESLNTVTAMVEGTETELVRLVYAGLLEESIEDMVRRDVECCYFLLGADIPAVDASCDHAFELAEGVTMTCDDQFRCTIVER